MQNGNKMSTLLLLKFLSWLNVSNKFLSVHGIQNTAAILWHIGAVCHPHPVVYDNTCTVQTEPDIVDVWLVYLLLGLDGVTNISMHSEPPKHR